MLKIVGRTPRIIREHRAPPATARGVTMRCDACQRHLHVAFNLGITAIQRQQTIKEAVDEHRRVCTVGVAEQRRTYEMWYPRA